MEKKNFNKKFNESKFFFEKNLNFKILILENQLNFSFKKLNLFISQDTFSVKNKLVNFFNSKPYLSLNFVSLNKLAGLVSSTSNKSYLPVWVPKENFITNHTIEKPVLYYNCLNFFLQKKLLQLPKSVNFSLTKVDYALLSNSDSFFSDHNPIKYFNKFFKLNRNFSLYYSNVRFKLNKTNFFKKYKIFLNKNVYNFFFIKTKINTSWFSSSNYGLKPFLKKIVSYKNPIIQHSKFTIRTFKNISSKKRYNIIYSFLKKSPVFLNKAHRSFFFKTKNLFKKTKNFFNNIKKNSFNFLKQDPVLNFNYKYTYSIEKSVSDRYASFYKLKQSSIQPSCINTRLNLSFFKQNFKNSFYLNPYTLTYFIFNSKMFNYYMVRSLFKASLTPASLNFKFKHIISNFFSSTSSDLPFSNIQAASVFKKSFIKKSFSQYSDNTFHQNLIPWYHNSLIRFIEHISGKKALVQFYPFLNESISLEWRARYLLWLPRFRSYERMLGHKFFLEESLHIIHLSFILKDSKLFSKWLKTMILRISFWKTRSIFRFLKYLMLSHFIFLFRELKIKGLKIKLKGKISAAGNSRKRSIIYRVGKTSNSELDLKVDFTESTINTFTGVMGFRVWLFY